MGIDRDEDGHFDRDELDAGSDPADAASVPVPPTPIRAGTLRVRDDDTPPVGGDRRRLSFKSSKHQGVPSGVVVPPFGSAGDPTASGAILRVYGGGAGAPVALALPAAGWRRTGSDARQLQLGRGVVFCAVAPAKDPAPSNDTTARFNGARHTPPPVTCPRVPSP